MYPRTNIATATDTKTNATATASVATPGTTSRRRLAFLHASVEAGAAQLVVTTRTGETNEATIFQATVTPGGPVNLAFGSLGPQGLPDGDITATLGAAGTGNDGTVSIGTYLEG